MTEIERIKQEGWLPESFWKEEVRCGHLVTAEMKQLWAILLDLYKEFARVCEENNLQYFAVVGTLLGAVRHKGIIPWDDDLDVALPRKDYDKLKTLASKFKHPYFLQFVDAAPEYGYSTLQLCNSNTTLLVEPFNYCPFNHGVHIDIAAIDKVSSKDYLQRRNQIKELVMQNSARMRINHPNKDSHSLEVIEKYYQPEKSAKDIFYEIERLASMDKDNETDCVSHMASPYYPPEKTLLKANAYDDFEVVPFETINIRIPKRYDEILATYYGDYMAYPPKEIRESVHTFKVFPEIPYIEYYKKNFGLDFTDAVKITGGGV